MIPEAKTDITLASLEEMCEEAFKVQGELDTLEMACDELRKKLTVSKGRIQGVLEQFGKKKYDSAYGNIELRERTSVRTPKTEEEKRQLFQWLTDKGIYWETVGVNSQTLNALFKAEFEAAAERHELAEIPGIGAPEVFVQPILKPRKH